ncbi:MAG: penicillin-binding protein 2 [Candidatus Berkelbacteria bacterium]|nr:penicillin-binding protein 2 [Candidatus Berkelbacteria bacterium]
MAKPRFSIKDYLGEHVFFDDHVDGSEVFTRSRGRSAVWGVLFAFVFFVAIAVALFRLQVQEGFVNLSLAEGNRLKNVPLAAPRGVIYDDQGEPLVTNEPIYQLVVQASRVKDIEKIDPKAFELTQVTKEGVIDKVRDDRQRVGLVVLRDKIARDDALLLKSRLVSYSQFEVVESYVRHYTDPALSHILGYIGKLSQDEATGNPTAVVNRFIGKSGLEKKYDEYLQGMPGTRKAEVDASGRVMRLLSTTEPQKGDDLYTSIDSELQIYLTSILKSKAEGLQTKAAAVVMDPRDGSVKALASIPYYDNSKMSFGLTQEEYDKIAKDENLPLFDRAIAGTYPPGSSIKPFIASAGLTEGVVNDSIAFDTPSEIVIGDWHFPDWKDHGTTDIKRAIAESNNIFFFAVGGGWGPIKQGLGVERIKTGLEKFSYGSKTGIDLPGEAEGFIPTPEWKKKKKKESWYIGDTYNLSIGQGDLSVTPLQLANATATIANGGKLFKPHFAKKIIEDNKEVKEFTDTDYLVAKDVFPAGHLKTVREGMRMTITQGSAYSVFGDGFPIKIAGKTGTAQFGNKEKTHAWFTSFAPYDDPQIVVTILIEGGGEGYQTAAPLAKQVYQWWAGHRT